MNKKKFANDVKDATLWEIIGFPIGFSVGILVSIFITWIIKGGGCIA